MEENMLYPNLWVIIKKLNTQERSELDEWIRNFSFIFIAEG